ncbi:MAG: PorT family protein [Williamsia sp.]|nr:PorT family protein [Williamsia sp.]
MHHLLRRKSTLILFACMLLAGGSASAQLRDRINLPGTDEKPYHLGIIIMGAQSRLQINQHPLFLQRDSVLVSSPENTFGLGIGGMHTLTISDRFQVRVVFPQLLFVNKAITYKLKYPTVEEAPVITKNIESILLGVPVQVKFRSDRINNFRFYIMGGFKAEYDLSSKARAKNAEELVKLQPVDYGIEAGVGFNFYLPYFILSPEIKISNGISNSHSRDPDLKFSNVIDKMKTRMVVFSLIFEG